MTDFPYISGADISAIANKEFIRFETDKAQAIVIALDKSDIPFSARFSDTEMVLTFDGSYKEQVEGIIAKAMSGDYEALLRELQVYGVPDGYFRLLGEVAELLNTTIGALKNHPDEIQIALCKTYTDYWLCDDMTIQKELDRILSVNDRTLTAIREHEQKREHGKTPEKNVAENAPILSELFESYNRRNAHAHFTRESLRQLSEIARRKQQTEQEQSAQRDEFERSRRS